MLCAALNSRAARAIDEPISPAPINARRSTTASDMRGSFGCRWRLRPEFAQGVDDKPVGFLAADGEAQEFAHAIGLDGAQDQPAFGKEMIGVIGGLSRRVGKANGDEIGDAGQHFETKRGDLLREPWQPARVMRDGFFNMRDILKRSDAGSGARPALSACRMAKRAQRLVSRLSLNFVRFADKSRSIT